MPLHNSKKILNRESFLKRRTIKQIVLPDDSIVCIRTLAASILVNAAADTSSVFEPSNLLVNSLCDEQGELLFNNEEKEQAMSVDYAALKVILDGIVDLNGLSTNKEAGNLEKN